MVHKSLDIAKPGDVVVIDAHGSKGTSINAALGDIISTKAKHRGIAGFIVDGSIRDLPGILELDLPVFARGTTVMGPLHRGPGEVNYPIACGGTVINPGDVMVADASGIVAIPRGRGGPAALGCASRQFGALPRRGATLRLLGARWTRCCASRNAPSITRQEPATGGSPSGPRGGERQRSG
jgi:hypothetical protein